MALHWLHDQRTHATTTTVSNGGKKERKLHVTSALLVSFVLIRGRNMKSGVRKLIQNVLLGQRRTVSSNLIPLSRQGALLGVDTSRTVRCSSSSSRSTENKVNDQFEASSVDTTVKGDGSSSTDSNGEELTSSATKKEVHEEEKGKDAVLSEELKEAVAHERSKPPPSIVDQIIAMLGIKTGTPFTYSTAKSLLDNCLVSSKKNYWFDDSMGKIGKDFRSRHTLLLIYVWMIHKRLLKMGEKGQDIQVIIPPASFNVHYSMF